MPNQRPVESQRQPQMLLCKAPDLMLQAGEGSGCPTRDHLQPGHISLRFPGQVALCPVQCHADRLNHFVRGSAHGCVYAPLELAICGAQAVDAPIEVAHG